MCIRFYLQGKFARLLFSGRRLSGKISLIILIVYFCASCSFIDDIIGIEPPDDNGPDPEPNKVRFVAMGDTGKGNQGQYAVAEAVKNKCDQDGCDFVLLLGDNIYYAGVSSVTDEQFQAKFELPYKDINLPFYLVLGNHDYGGSGKGEGYEVVKSIYQIQYTEKSQKWIMPGHYYQFQKNNITLFALDSNAQLFGVAKEQQEDVSAWIKNADTQWKIAFAHHPYKSNGPHGDAGRYEGVPGVPIVSGDDVKKFADTVWCGKVDVYLSGHDHSRQWLEETCEGTQLVVSGAGASTTELPGDNPVLFQADTLGFLYVVIEDNMLDAQFIDKTGKVEFSKKLLK